MPIICLRNFVIMQAKLMLPKFCYASIGSCLSLFRSYSTHAVLLANSRAWLFLRISSFCFSSCSYFSPFSLYELILSFRDPSEEKTVENFLEEEGVEENTKSKILKIIKEMGKLVKKTKTFLPMFLLFHVLQLKWI